MYIYIYIYVYMYAIYANNDSLIKDKHKQMPPHIHALETAHIQAKHVFPKRKLVMHHKRKH